jgi:hypothetical protein
MLNKEQHKLLMKYDCSGEEINQKDLKILPGFHYCPDWDFMAMCDDSPEIITCTCEIIKDD